MNRFVIPAALAAMTFALPATAETPAKVAGKVVVPFEMLKSGHMAVEVKVNGKGPYLLIFDTGAPMTLVNNKLAVESGMKKGGSAGGLGGLGGMFSAGEAKMKTLSVGGQSADDVPAVVMDHPTVEAIAGALKKPICGLVGYPFFARYKMTIDYEAKTMTLVPNGFKPPDVMKLMTASMLSGSSKKPLAPAAQWGVMAAKKADDEDAGVDVTSVVAGSAADKAGMKRGDRLLILDGRWTDSLADLYEAAGFVKPGAKVTVKVRRGGKEMEIEVTPGKGL